MSVSSQGFTCQDFSRSTGRLEANYSSQNSFGIPTKTEKTVYHENSKKKREKIGEIRNFPESNSSSESTTYECDLDSDNIEDSSVDKGSSSQNEAYPVPCISSPQSAAERLDFDVSTLESAERYNSDYKSSDSSESVNEFSLTGFSTENF